MNQAKLFVSSHQAVLLVLHKIVFGKKVNWEDVDVTEFKKILDYIKNNSLHPDHDKSIYKKQWILTFDDGNISDYEVVFPLLTTTGITAIFFVITEKIGTLGYLSKKNILEMHNKGMCIGSHSLSHKLMTNLSLKEAKKEFKESKLYLEDIIGANVDTFSYPYGEYTFKLNQLGFAEGYQSLFSSSHGIANKNDQILPRNSINSNMNWDDIITILEPGISKRISWLVEDKIKIILKKTLGFENYKYFRTLVGSFLK